MMSSEVQPTYMNVKEAAAYLRVSVAWIYLEVRKGNVPCVHFGRSVRFRREDLDAWAKGKRS